MNPIAVFALTCFLGALLQVVTGRTWVAILIPACVAATFFAFAAGLFKSGKHDSVAVSVFLGFLPVALVVYMAAAAVGAAIAAALQKKK
jgi:hypothetical protein